MRVIEAGQHAGFPLETSQSIGIVRKRRRQYLDRHVAAEPRVTGPVHLAHPAHADPLMDEIHAEPTAGQAGAGIVSDRPRNRRRRQALEPSRRCGLVEQGLHLALQ